MKDYFSSSAKSLISQLLERNPRRRLGYGPDGTQEIMQHPFFAKINWQALADLKIDPPFKPVTMGPNDCRNID